MILKPVTSLFVSLILTQITACTWFTGPDRWVGETSYPVETPAAGEIISLDTPTPAVTQPATSATPAVTPTSGFTPPLQAAARTIKKDITYCQPGSSENTLDLYYPGQFSTTYPLVIFIHGGGWSGGDKGVVFGQGDFPALLRAGFVIASINYRLVPENPFPIPIEDAKCAVRFLRANAATLQIDPDRIGVMGESAGGHLAAMIGTTDASARLEGDGGWSEASSQVQAVVDLYGPTDLSMLGKNTAGLLILKKLFNQPGLPTDAQLSTHSPITYISADDPPVLIIHGENDKLVQIEQAREYYETLQQFHVSSELVIVKNAGHGLIPVAGDIDPTRKEITAQIVAFFEEHLK